MLAGAVRATWAVAVEFSLREFDGDGVLAGLGLAVGCGTAGLADHSSSMR
ncbi:hypothetical protein K1W54_04655 [Micromonospora sp. CPCC 205371]|nr:hypothetical protein [Micromonospora sp. CPCC 205371]